MAVPTPLAGPASESPAILPVPAAPAPPHAPPPSPAGGLGSPSAEAHPPPHAPSLRVSRYMFRRHTFAELANGAYSGVYELHQFIARKGLGASELQITLMATLSSFLMIFGAATGAAMEHVPKRRFQWVGGLMSRLPFLGMCFVTDPWSFFALCCVSYLGDPVFIPAQNAMYQANYSPAVRGRYFGLATAIGRLSVAATAIGASFWLDLDRTLYRVIMPVAGVVGILATVIYATTRIRGERSALRRAAPAAGISWKAKLRDVLTILREDRRFNRFERNYFIYGLGFMMLLPVTVFALVDRFNLKYEQISLARLVVMQIVFLVVAPLSGRLLDKLKAGWTSAAAFGVLTLYPLFMLLALHLHAEWALWLSFGAFGAAMALVNTSWSLGPMEFAGPRNASAYMGIHVACVGVRGLMGGFLGLWIMQAVSLEATFWAAAGCFAVAAVLMIRLGSERTAGPAGVAA